MANVSSIGRVDFSVNYTWDWAPVSGTPTVIEVRGPVFYGRFVGKFVIDGASVTGTATDFQFARNGVNQLTIGFVTTPQDAAVVATYMDAGDTAQAAFAYLLRGDDSEWGSFVNDTLRGYAGNDTLTGNEGIDTAVYAGPRANYTIVANNGNISYVTDNTGAEGRDTLFTVERLKFSDMTVAVDIAGNAGKAYRLYQSAFNRTPDQGGLGFQMRELDNGQSLTQVAQNFINSPEFSATYGSLNTTQFVTQLYANVLHRAPDSGGLAYHTGNISAGMSRAQVLVGFSESPENQAALIGTMQNGMVYVL